ncbi:MAG: lysophospholipid acyltransferase family protein, partial [Flavobacteriales bacterium]
MKYIKIPFLLICRLWFYILMFVTIILLLPLLFILSAKETYYAAFWRVARFWSKILVYGMGFSLKVTKDQELDRSKSYMFCPNHASLMDAFVLIVLSKNPIVFVGKKEFVKIPIF